MLEQRLWESGRVLTEEIPQWTIFNISNRSVLCVMTHLIFPAIRVQRYVHCCLASLHPIQNFAQTRKAVCDLSLLTSCHVVFDITAIAG